MQNSTVLCLDVALSNVGVAVWSSRSKRFVHAECIRTERQDSRYASLDRARRCQQICGRLVTIMDLYSPSCVLAELPHGSQNANAATSLGLASGLVIALCASRMLPLHVIQPVWTKKFVGGNDKSLVINKAVSIFGSERLKMRGTTEHIADAMICIAVARTRPEMRSIKNLL